MILPDAVARGVADGSVDRVYRRWTRSRVRAGSSLRTSGGVVTVVAVTEVDPSSITDDDAVAAGAGSAETVRRSFRGTGDDPVFRIDLRAAGPDPRVALRRDRPDADALADVVGRLERLDRASRHGPWTGRTLRLIAGNPGLRAAELALLAGRDRDPFKRDVRKLKELGLTESLEVGYRLSPRGEAVLTRIG